jgi:glyoxylase-like metal-dependent hydrolase (beta-lactamase superfamily II)
MWDELAEGVFRRRYETLDLNIGLVIGDAGALVFDTRASHRQAQVLIGEIASITTKSVRWAVNSHWHWDHSFGNHEFAGAALYGHERCRDRLLVDGAAAKRDASKWVGEAGRAELDEVVITPPTNTFSRDTTIDLGSRSVQLAYLGDAHTDNDIVMTVSGTDVVFGGDIIEESAPPYFGDSYPLAWPDTVAAMRELGTLFVPGHGDVMSAERVATQHEELQAVAERCVDYLTTGIFDATAGPYPEATMQSVLERLPQRD